MIVTNHQPQYLPYLGFFHKITKADLFVVMDDVQFMDRGFQHRNSIKMQTGKQWLTVPLNYKRFEVISDVKIDVTQNWRRKQWAAIQTNYVKAPFFAELGPELRAILMDGGHVLLAQLNIDLMRWVLDKLRITTPIKLSSTLGITGEKSERHINICRAVGADTYLSGPGGRLYMDMDEFARNDVNVLFQEYRAKEYPQLYPQLGFIPDLAIVDPLFNVGVEGTRALIQD